LTAAPGTLAPWRPSGVGFAVGALVGFLLRELDAPGLVSYWGDRTPFLVVPAAGGAALWALRPARRLLAAAAATLAALWLVVAYTPLCAHLARGLVRRDPPAAADAVFVLASRLQADGDPTTAAMSRLLHGLELLQDGRAPRLVVSELPPPHASHAALARSWMRRWRLDQELLSVGPVRNTRQEAVAVAALCRARGITRVLLVTSPTHSRRAAAAFEREGLTVLSSPSVETGFDLETLDRPEDRLWAWGKILHERVGFWVYARRGWIAERPGATSP
jgi:uncharacterized SAM-binding protein YcdF (DUF218 family)